MAKPIFIVGVPDELTDNDFLKIKENLIGQLRDYHTLVYTHTKTELEFNAFYEKDFNEVKYEELKELIFKLIKERGDEIPT
jgi:hypothetical protein